MSGKITEGLADGAEALSDFDEKLCSNVDVNVGLDFARSVA